MSDQIQYEARSEAANPGETFAIGTASEEVFSAEDVSGSLYFWLYNNSDETIWVRYAATGAAAGAGKPILPGGYLEELFYRGPVCAVHGGSGNKNLVGGVV